MPFFVLNEATLIYANFHNKLIGFLQIDVVAVHEIESRLHRSGKKIVSLQHKNYTDIIWKNI